MDELYPQILLHLLVGVGGHGGTGSCLPPNILFGGVAALMHAWVGVVSLRAFVLDECWSGLGVEDGGTVSEWISWYRDGVAPNLSPLRRGSCGGVATVIGCGRREASFSL